MRQSRLTISRREFIRYGVCGLTAIAAGPLRLSPLLGVRSAAAAEGAVQLFMRDALVEMVDETPVYHWLFSGPDELSFPGPVIFARAGELLTLEVTNALNELHEFRIVGAGPGGTDLSSEALRPGETAVISFVPERAGTYLYLDPRNAPVNRVLGLHGVLVLLPADAAPGTSVNTPYTNPTEQVKRLFDDLGDAPQFPGDPWIPVRPEGVPPNEVLPPAIEAFLYRTRIWLFNQVDPRFNEIAERGGNAERGGGIDPRAFARDFLPRYFLINGKSGAFAAHDPGIALEGFIGEPHVVRTLNAGLATPSLHLHANNFYVLAVNNVVQESVFSCDTVTLRTLEGDPKTPPPAGGLVDDGLRFADGGSRVDWLVPFVRPGDIPGDPRIPLRQLLRQELKLELGDVPQSPLRYPMHDHTEQSQTAAGGNYPQGDVTDFIFLGDVDKVPFPNQEP